MEKGKKATTVDEYIAGQEPLQKTVLEQVRALIKKMVPKAEEVISYGMPAFKDGGVLVWYAAYTKHLGLYPRPNAIAAFKDKLAGYKMSKGAIQFPIDQPLPVKLITGIVKFRIKENADEMLLKEAAKGRKVKKR